MPNQTKKDLSAEGYRILVIFNKFLAFEESKGLESDGFLPGLDVTLEAARELGEEFAKFISH